MKHRQIPDTPKHAACLLLLLCTPIFVPAQETDDEDPLYELQPVTVVGTRIRGIDLETTLPVQIFATKDLDLTGYTRVDDVLRNLSIMTGESPNGIQEGDERTLGTRAVNMRGMGEAANLVLVNGLRVPFFDNGGSIYPYYNISAIPAGSIASVQVLADGASAVYGSDAVSGVIDFRTLQEYDGTRLEFNLGTYEGTHSDEASMTLIHGMKFASHGNLVIALNHYERNNLKWAEYPFWEDLNYLDMGGLNSNSRWTYPATVYSLEDAMVDPFYDNDFTYSQPTENPTLEQMVIRPWPLYLNDGGFNYNTDMDKMGDNTETGLYLHFDYNLNEKVSAYIELYHQRTWERMELAGAPYWSFGHFPFPASNPYNPFGVSRADGEAPKDVWYMEGRLGDAGTRVFETTIKVPRIVTGLKGKLGSEWNWELAAVASESASELTQSNVYRGDKFLDLIEGHDLNGNGIIERDEYFNPFGPNSEELYAYMRGSAIDEGKYELCMADAHASGDLWKIKSISVSAAIGAEYRSERMSTELDELTKEGAFIGGYGENSDVFGAREVASAYGEVQLKYEEILTILGAGRYENYSDSEEVTTPKVSFSFKLLPEVMLRGSYGEGFVAPTLPVMNRPQVFGWIYDFYELYDPKRDEIIDYNIRAKEGGNPGLKPETSTNYTAGIVIEPFTRIKESNSLFRALKGLTLGTTYNQIDYVNLWWYPDAQFLLDNEDQLQLIFPGQDIRVYREHSPEDDPNEIPKVTQINMLWANVGYIKYSGWDFWLEWPINLDNLGSLKLRWDASKLQKQENHYFDWLNDDEDSLPDFKWVGTIQWQRGNWSTAIYLREVTGIPRSPDEPDRPTAEASFRINAQVSYSGWKDAELTVGVRNLMNEDPSFHGYSNHGYAGMHPVEKRFWYIRINKHF